MVDQFTRTELLIGKQGLEKLSHAHVAVFGIGGVGSFVAEALARSNVGTLSLFDNDEVAVSNINRQLIATTKTIGQAKVKVMKDRILDINPNATVYDFQQYFSAETQADIKFSEFDYIVDAIDTVTSKLLLIQIAKKLSVPIISCMGAGNKLDPTRFEVADIYETSICPLAKVMRKELRQRNIEKLKVVYSKEPALTPGESNEEPSAVRKRQTPGSVAFVPSVAGLILAGEVVKDIVNHSKTQEK